MKAKWESDNGGGVGAWGWVLDIPGIGNLYNDENHKWLSRVKAASAWVVGEEKVWILEKINYFLRVRKGF